MGGELFKFPYDAKEAGAFGKDKVIQHSHFINGAWTIAWRGTLGYGVVTNETSPRMFASIDQSTGNINIPGDVSSYETTPAWLAVNKYIAY